MAKDPAFLFYPGDWLGGTLGFSHEEKGIYMDLLIMQFNNGHMTYDMMAQMIGHKLGQVWDKLSKKFEKDSDGLYYNIKLDKEKERRKAFTASRYNNKTGKNQFSDKDGHMTNHMETATNNNTLHNLKHNKVKLTENEKNSENGYGGAIRLSGADRLAKKLYEQQQNKANEL